MHEDTKLGEAEYFLSQLTDAQHRFVSADIFKYNLSAFLSAARSVAQYALKEAQLKNGGQQWYDTFVSSTSVARFLKDKRDINIHTEPVAVRQDTGMQMLETLHLADSLEIVVRDAQGNIKETRKPPEAVPPPGAYQAPIVTVVYKFDDWSGNENVVELCITYLKELRTLVTDGRSKGFVT